jgi:tripartite-type tricarboxylate transporter receptor subunit TctC
MRMHPAVLAFAVLLSLTATRARAQDAYPSKTVTMIVPFAAGGSTDVIGRIIAEGLR